jgi:hypothetical protein
MLVPKLHHYLGFSILVSLFGVGNFVAQPAGCVKKNDKKTARSDGFTWPLTVFTSFQMPKNHDIDKYYGFFCY